MNNSLTSCTLLISQSPETQRVEICTGESDAEWDAFVASVPGGSHLQTSLWGDVKSTLRWRAVRLLMHKDNQILAGVQLLTRKLAPGFDICYVTRGPLISHGFEHLAASLIKEILLFSRKSRFTYLVIQPPTNADYLVPGLLHNGFECSNLELAPTASILVDLHQDEDQLLSNMKRQTRQNIRRSVKDGITSRSGTYDDIPVFYQLHYKTSQRQNFRPYSIDYFYKMWASFAPSRNICLIFTEFNHEPVSGLLLIPYGDSVCAKLLGWSGSYPEHRPNDALFWAAIQWSRSNRYTIFDFEGIDREGAIQVLHTGELPETLHHSPDFLKLGFGGQVKLFPEAFAYSFNPVLRSITRKLDLKVGGQNWTSKVIDRIRKQ